MPKRPRAHINPKALVWARESSGFSTLALAKKLYVKAEKVAEWESGKTAPTMNQLRSLGAALGRPSAFFFSGQTPEALPHVPDYRQLPDVAPPYSPRLLYEIRRAVERREIALDLAAQHPSPATNFALSGTVSEGAEVLAARIRAALGISVEDQIAWNGEGYLALRRWISSVEDLGALVFQTRGVEVATMRGFSLADRPLPTVVLNGADSVRGRIFTLMHELAHLVIGKGGLCDFQSGFPIEVFCNEVAGTLLVPSEALLSQRRVRRHGLQPEWEDADLRYLANRFVVSKEVILRRLLRLERTSADFYSMKRKEYSTYAAPKPSGSGGPPQYRMILRDNGLAFTDMVIGAYHDDRITESLMSTYLGGINLKHLGALEEALA